MADGTPSKEERLAVFWNAQIEQALKERKKWLERARKTVKRFRDERPTNASYRRMNILYANMELLKPAVYSQTPKADVVRRWKHDVQDDGAARDATAISTVLESALNFTMDDGVYDFDRVAEQTRDDGLLVGLGQLWIRYEPVIKKLSLTQMMPEQMGNELQGPEYPTDDAMPGIGDEDRDFAPFYVTKDGQEFDEPDGEDEDGPFVEVKVDDRVWCEYVFWEDYLESPARTWGDVWWVGRRHRYTRSEGIREYGDVFKEVKLTETLEGANKRNTKNDKIDDDQKRGEVWEVWDREHKRVLHIAKGHDVPLKVIEDDPLKVESFFPCPPPYMPLSTTNTREPLPEFVMYQDQAEEIDRLTSAIAELAEQIKVRGIYPQVLEKMGDILKSNSATMHPVKDWQQFMQLGGLDKAVSFLPIEIWAQALAGLIQQREVVKAEIYEIIGISDIIRGATNPNETASAQNIKASMANVRSEPRRKPFARFLRDALRIKGEIIANHFAPETLYRMTGMELSETQLQMLRDDGLRNFRLDIETDTMRSPDSQRDKQEAAEFVQSMSQLMAGAVNWPPHFAPIGGEIIKLGFRQFKHGRRMEETVEKTVEQAVQMAMQSVGQQEQQGEDPAVQQAKVQIEGQRLQLDAQKLQIEGQKMQLEGQRTQAEMANEQQRIALEGEKLGLEVEGLKAENALKWAELALKRDQAGADADLKAAEMAQRGELEREKIQAQKDKPTNGAQA